MTKTISIELTESSARYVLQALHELKDKCKKIVDDDEWDEDDQFFYANDLMETDLVMSEIEKIAVDTFGENVTDFSHETL